MDTAEMTTKKALVVVGAVMLLLMLSFVIPAKYVGISSREKPLMLKSVDDLTMLSRDTNHNNIPDWRDMAINTMSTTTKEQVKNAKVDPEAQKRLDDPNNLTASFSKNLYIASALAKKNNQELTEGEQEDLVATILEGEKAKIIIKNYSASDIQINKTETDALKKAYGNALGLLLKKAQAYKIAEEDIQLIQSYTTSKDASLLEAFKIKRDNIDTLIKTMTTMSVPYSAVPYHVLALNKISAYRSTIDNFAQANTDPIRSAIVINSYLDVAQSMLNALDAMKEYFRISNITFSANESGYVFTSGYTKK
jgi:hypothetical protein